MSKLYIAYGSNLNKRQMRLRCPTARPLGKFTLTSARLVFRGVADLEYEPGASTPCGLWVINRDDERQLDVYEGVNYGTYFKSEEIELEYLGQKRKSVIYLTNSEGVYPPSQAYANTIRQGYRDFDLDERFLDEAIARSFDDKNPDEFTMARRERQRATQRHRTLVEFPIDIAMQRIDAKKEG